MVMTATALCEEKRKENNETHTRKDPHLGLTESTAESGFCSVTVFSTKDKVLSKQISDFSFHSNPDS
jgi:hypothetical protein